MPVVRSRESLRTRTGLAPGVWNPTPHSSPGPARTSSTPTTGGGHGGRLCARGIRSMTSSAEPAHHNATPRPAGDRMYAALSTSLGKHKDAKFIAVGTRCEDDSHWFTQMLDGAAETYAQVHASTKDTDDFGHAQILKANPAYRHLEPLRERLRKEQIKAASGSAQIASWRALRLNRGTPDVVVLDPVVTLQAWDVCTTGDLPPRQGPVAIGFDLGGSTSMTALVAYCPECGRLEVYGAFPSDPSLAERGHQRFRGRPVRENAQPGRNFRLPRQGSAGVEVPEHDG